MRGVAVCRRLSPSAGASVLTIPRFLSASRRLGSADARCTTPATHDNLSFEAQSRGSRTRCLRFAAFLLSRGRTATQDSLPAGGQPLPDGGHDPARSLMKFQPHLHGFLLIQAFATQATSELDCAQRCRQYPGLRLQCATAMISTTSE
jgi:hypothetical protein